MWRALVNSAATAGGSALDDGSFLCCTMTSLDYIFSATWLLSSFDHITIMQI